ncbi:hypothetical protein AB0O01_26905 [Streptomyces sp. NPDC093252]|uniref:hypothetical protein n=1 Tax=Streptomyces sp. NPDC093252 TaxID=3154980 RepID=UPI00341BF7BF
MPHPHNHAQDTYESLRRLLAQIDVAPASLKVDWCTEDAEPTILVGALTIMDTLRLTRAIRVAVEHRQRGADLSADRPHRPMAGETVLDTAADEMGEVVGYVLRPLAPGDPWTADPDHIRPPDRDRLIRARLDRLDRDQRSNPSNPLVLVPSPPADRT